MSYPLDFRLEGERLNDRHHPRVLLLGHGRLKVPIYPVEIRDGLVPDSGAIRGFYRIALELILLKNE